MASARLYAVLTGDLIKSRALAGQKIVRARQELDHAAKILNSWESGTVAGDPEFFRGDSWQMALSSPHLSLRAALLVRALLRWRHGADSRISIGIGGVERIDKRATSMSTGPAFVASGLGLDAMPARASMTLSCAAGDDGMASALVQLCGVTAGRWTQRQAELVAAMIHPSRPTQAQIAKRLGVRQQSVQPVLASANWVAIRDALEAFEAVEWQNV